MIENFSPKKYSFDDIKAKFMEACPHHGDIFDLPERLYLPSMSIVNNKIKPYAYSVTRISDDFVVGNHKEGIDLKQLTHNDRLLLMDSINKALLSNDIAIIERPTDNGIKDAVYHISMYQGKQANDILEDILCNAKEVQGGTLYDSHPGAKGVFEEEGKYIAFDNCTQDCWVEEFYTKASAYGWCSGEYDADCAHERSEEVEAERDYVYNRCIAIVKERMTDNESKMFDTPKAILLRKYLWLYEEKERPVVARKLYNDAYGECHIKSLLSRHIHDVREELNELANGKIRSKSDVSSSKVNIVKAIVDRVNDPTPDAHFSKEQQDDILKYLQPYPSVDKKLQALSELWQLAEKNPRMKGVYGEWKEPVKEELNDLASGIRRDDSQENYLKM